MTTVGLRFSKRKDTYCILRAKKALIPLCCVSLGPLHFFTSFVTVVGFRCIVPPSLSYGEFDPFLVKCSKCTLWLFSDKSSQCASKHFFFLEKTPMCLINELARHNKTTHQYRLTDETGIFFFILRNLYFSFKFNKTWNFVSGKPLEK